YTLFPHDRGELREPRRARCNPFLDLDHIDDVEPEAARKIGPGVVIGDEARGAMWCEQLLPSGETCSKPREKAVAVGDDLRGCFRAAANDRLCNSAADDLCIGRVEPIVWIGEAMCMPVAAGGVQARSFDFEQGNAERGVDITGTAALDRGIALHRQQLIEPMIVTECDPNDDRGSFKLREGGGPRLGSFRIG